MTNFWRILSSVSVTLFCAGGIAALTNVMAGLFFICFVITVVLGLIIFHPRRTIANKNESDLDYGKMFFYLFLVISLGTLYLAVTPMF